MWVSTCVNLIRKKNVQVHTCVLLGSDELLEHNCTHVANFITYTYICISSVTH